MIRCLYFGLFERTIMSWIEEKYALLAFSGLRNFKEKRHNPPLYNFSCPACGDSKLDPTKARGYLYEKDGKLRYKCHNCDFNSFSKLLKMVSPDLHKMYVIELFGDRRKPKKEFVGKGLGKATEKTLTKHKSDPASVMKPLTKEHREYLEERKIFNHSDFRTIPDMTLLKPFLEDDLNLYSEDRIGMPVYDQHKEMIGVACRTTNPKSDLRYINLKFSEAPMIYNAFNVNRNETVFALEGILDSKFVTNSIAVCGSDLIKAEEVIPKENLVLVFDNQPRNRQLLKKIQTAISAGFSVVIWPSNTDKYGKDINKMILSGVFDSQKIDDTIRENTFRGMKAMAKFKAWKKIV